MKPIAKKDLKKYKPGEVITEEQYSRLHPYRQVIFMYGEQQIYVGGADISTLNNIYVGMGQVSGCNGCSGSIGSMLQYFYNQMVKYEQQESI